MKKIILTLIALLISTITFADCYGWKEGDVVFQISKSKQSPLIQMATHSVWSHCGIVVKKGNAFYVLEASNVVKLTPADEWVDRGRFCIIKVRRMSEKPVKIHYSQYLGKPYDLSFKFNNNRWYCSELVYDIYLKQFGVQLCKPRKVKDYHLFGLSKKMRQRGITEDQEVVAPSDLLDSKLLYNV